MIESAPLLLGSDGYNLNRSVRIRSSATGYFERTPASAGSLTAWTWSGWVKRGALGVESMLFSAGTGGANPRSLLSFNVTTNTLDFGDNATGSLWYELITTAVFRDPAAWYHIVAVYDSANATSTDRMRLYVNGIRITAFSTASYPILSTSSVTNTAIVHRLGRYAGGAETAYFDGCMTEINFIGGQALTAASFGEFNLYNQWVPKKYAGTYGTNGFYLNFNNNSASTATTIGKDNSGLNNNWTPNNISVTAGTSYDSMTDVPTLTSATAANYAVLNPLTKASQGTIDNGNLHAYTGGLASIIAVATMQITGNTYWECVSVNNTNIVAGVMFGELPNVGSTWFPSASSYAMFASGGALYTQNATASQSATPSWSAGNTLGFAWNNSARTLTLYVNNTLSSVMTITAPSTQPFPVFANYSSTPATDITANFGQQGFTYTPPSGYVALNTYNL